MRMLVREFEGDVLNYVWKNVEVRPSMERGFRSSDGGVYEPYSLLDVKNDNRGKFVICETCGKLIPNNPEAILKHTEERKAKADCIKCTYAKLHNVRTESDTLRQLKSGRVMKVTKKVGDIICDCGYRMRLPEESKSRGDCIYYKCRIRTGFDDIWARYPHAFDYLVTEAQLLNKGWRCVDNGGYECICGGRRFKYKQYNLFAYTDKNGVVVYFRAKTRNTDKSNLRYSKRYDKFFYRQAVEELRNDWGYTWGDRGDFYATVIKELYN